MAKLFRKLTRACIRKLPAGGRITEHGVTFELLTNGGSVYSGNITVDRKRIDRVIGRASEGVNDSASVNGGAKMYWRWSAPLRVDRLHVWN